MQNDIFNDFSAGWIPSDDSINGRKNGLLKMESVELDHNGALVMSGGTKRINAFGGETIHSIFSKFLNGIKYRWAVSTFTHFFRNGIELGVSESSTSRAAFGVAWDFVIICSGSSRLKDNGISITALGLTTPGSAPTVISAGAGVLTGDYEYAQIVVNNAGTGYIAKSALSIPSSITVADENVTITPANPPSVDAQCNETWIFRRGGLLDEWYRIAVVTDATPFDDSFSDEDALDLGILFDSNTVSVAAASISEDFLAIVGPVNRRHLFFTASKVYFSEINSPDSTNPNTALAITGNSSELFLWAKQVGENIVVIGTTEKVYLLTGSYITQPDNTLDVYLRNLAVKETPISIDVASQGSDLFYMAANGWVRLNLGGGVESLCSPNVDVLYRGETKDGNQGVPIYVHPTLFYRCCIAKNKLWTVVPQIVGNDPDAGFTYRMDIYDLIRKYWRTFPLTVNLGRGSENLELKLIYAEEDDNIIGWFSSDNYLKDLDNPFVKTLANATTDKQAVKVRTLFLTDPSYRKTPTNLCFWIDTGGDNASLNLYLDGLLTPTAQSLGFINANGWRQITLDLTNDLGPIKNISIEIYGNLANFRLTGIGFYYEQHPQLTRHVKILKVGSDANKKRIRTLPFVINTLNHSVLIAPYVDGNALDTSTVTTNSKKTVLHQIKTDAFGIDYAVDISGDYDFELWEVLQPEIVQTLPVAKRYDQIGPIELFKYGKLKTLELRILAFSGTTIPYSILFEDTELTSGNLTVLDSKECVATVPLPKTTAGTILRVVLGPTTFDFHRLSSRIQVTRSGKDSEMEWVSL